jgi:deoxyribonuclease (pyrimidine dimer)
MTRINADLDPRTLKRANLLAELREITMVPASLRRSLRTKTQAEVLKNIPKEFTLGTGHVRFFYDKLQFLIHRVNKLTAEMEQRGYNPDRARINAFDGFDNIWHNNWVGTDRDNNIVSERINFRISQKPHLYKD